MWKEVGQGREAGSNVKREEAGWRWRGRGVPKPNAENFKKTGRWSNAAAMLGLDTGLGVWH